MTDTIRPKLQSPAALNPSANYILELGALFAEEGTYRKDREAISLLQLGAAKRRVTKYARLFSVNYERCRPQQKERKKMRH